MPQLDLWSLVYAAVGGFVTWLFNRRGPQPLFPPAPSPVQPPAPVVPAPAPVPSPLPSPDGSRPILDFLLARVAELLAKIQPPPAPPK